MQTLVFASSFIKASSDKPQLDQREIELMYCAPRQGLKDVARLAVALGGVALYAGILSLVAQ